MREAKKVEEVKVAEVDEADGCGEMVDKVKDDEVKIFDNGYEVVAKDSIKEEP